MIGTCAVMMVGTDVVNDSWYVWRWLARWCQWWIGTCEWVIGLMWCGLECWLGGRLFVCSVSTIMMVWCGGINDWLFLVRNDDWLIVILLWWMVSWRHYYLLLPSAAEASWWWRPIMLCVFSEAFLVLGRVRPQGGRAPFRFVDLTSLRWSLFEILGVPTFWIRLIVYKCVFASSTAGRTSCDYTFWFFVRNNGTSRFSLKRAFDWLSYRQIWLFES